jgi:SIR2-like domain
MGKAIVLGAGASRGVAYAQEMSMPSPLDSDFFDLLQRLDQSNNKFGPAVSFLIEGCLARPEERLWQSMEKLFYSLYLRATIQDVIDDGAVQEHRARVVKNFTRALDALLREAHGTCSCLYHEELILGASSEDSIITFNYDLVIERAIRRISPKLPSLGGWLYGFDARPPGSERVPKIYKLHGSSNWKRTGNRFEVRQKSWDEFGFTPGYRAHTSKEAPIILPFWDKRIEEEPWLPIWRDAVAALKQSSKLIVWGYSLPTTDFKSREIFRLAANSSNLKEVIVIDPSPDVRERWRELFVRQRFSYYPSYLHFNPRYGD